MTEQELRNKQIRMSKVVEHYNALKRTAESMAKQIDEDAEMWGWDNTAHLRGMRDGLLLAVSSLERKFEGLGE